MTVGKMSPDDIRKLLNKSAGQKISHNLNKDNPTNVKEWIPTGSRWLDSVVCRGKLSGIPVGKVTEIAGLESTGKSYMAAQIAANAQKMGIQVVYFDSESALDSSFLERTGCNVDNIIYTHGTHITVAHSMGSTLGINTMILLASIFYILHDSKTITKQYRGMKYSKKGFWILNNSFLIYWIDLIEIGILNSYYTTYIFSSSFLHRPSPFLQVLLYEIILNLK